MNTFSPEASFKHTRGTEMPESKWSELFDRDYAGSTYQTIMAYLSKAVDNEKRKETFYVEFQTEPIPNTGEYLKKHCEDYGYQYPEKIPDAVYAKMKILDAIVVDVQTAIVARASLKEIYAITRRFQTEGGFGEVAPIAQLE